jgi:hypothetical protein
MIKRWLSFLRPKPKTGKVKLTFRLKPGENVSVNITVKGAAPALSPDVVETPPITGPAGQQEPVSFTVSTQESGSAPVVSISQPAYVPAEVNVQQPETASTPMGANTLEGANSLKVADSGTVSSGNWQSILTRLGLDSVPRTTLILLGIALGLYLVTRLIALTSYPIYFYSDEAVAVMRGVDFLSYGLKDFNGTLLPTFFLNDGKFSLGTTVYLQVIPLLLFGKSIFAARAVTVLVGLLGMFWFSLTLVKIFKVPYAWAGAFLLVATPSWFLFSRLALETPVYTALYAGFIYYYLLYRLRDPRYLYPALVIGALAFYAYFPGEVVMVVTGVFLLLLDAPYHWQQRKTTLRGLVLLLLLVIPLVRFWITQPDQYATRLGDYGSFLASDVSLLSKVGTYLSNYLYGLSPFYWFDPLPHDPIWWVMKGYSPIAWFLAPFWAWGLVVIFRNLRKSEIRVLLAAYLAGPAGSALMSIEITRVLMMVIPLMMIITLGLSDLLERLQKRFALLSERLVMPVLAGLLMVSALGMTADALVNGPTWFTDYGIGGLQWGSKQVFSAALDLNKAYPDQNIRISGGWCWQADTMKRFFVPEGLPIEMGNADAFISEYKPEISNTIFILIPQDYQNAVASNKFSSVDVIKTIPAPDGTTGFYIVRLTYVPNAQALFQAEREEQIQLVSDTISVNGQQLTIWHTRLDADLIANLFDGNPDTYAHTQGVNPLVLDWALPTAQTVSGMRVRMGSEHAMLTLTVTASDGSQITKTVEALNTGDNKDVTVMLDAPVTSASHIHFELNDVDAAPDSEVHLWEVTILYQGQ